MKKSISTEPTPANIQAILRILADTPSHLEPFSSEMTEAQLHEPLGPGERSIHAVLVHLLNCEARAFEAIIQALLANEQVFPAIHPERELGKLLQLEQFGFVELLSYLKLRRTVLINILQSLTPQKWAREIRPEEKQRGESVYWQARGQALHELEHLQDIEHKLNLARV